MWGCAQASGQVAATESCWALSSPRWAVAGWRPTQRLLAGSGRHGIAPSSPLTSADLDPGVHTVGHPWVAGHGLGHSVHGDPWSQQQVTGM